MWRTEDSGLLYRALHAVYLYELFERANKDLDSIDGAEAKTVIKVKRAAQSRAYRRKGKKRSR